MLSRKYYKMIAKVISKSHWDNHPKHRHTLDKDQLIHLLCDEFKADNSLFNRDTFTSACDGD
jgi:hypothetical protein